MAGRNVNPFDDPFFRDPFAMMNDMMGNMNSMMGSMFNDPFFAGAGFGAPMMMMQQQRAMPRIAPPSTTVEEVHDAEGYAPSGQQPIIEEPDEDGAPPRSHQEQRRPARGMGQQPGSNLHMGGNLFNPNSFGAGAAAGSGTGGGGATYSYSSSSFMSNQNGVTYEKSTSARMGPDGVREVQATERDGRTGKQSITVTRGLGDRARTITRVRDGSGQETSQDELRGIQQEEAHRFDDEWRQRAERNLLPLSGQRQYQSQRQYALPSSNPPQSQPHYPTGNQPAYNTGYQPGSSSRSYNNTGSRTHSYEGSGGRGGARYA